MADYASSTGPHTEDLCILLIAMGTGVLVATLYHLITTCLWHQHFQNSQQMSQAAQSPSAAEIPVANLIPAHKYRRKKERASENETCAVCLGDFEEGEELKTLPECMHSFHVLCIDMWLYSNSNCPVCRADALPSPAVIPP